MFESAIDLLSFATLMKQAGNDYRQEHLLSLSGVYKPPEDIRQAKVPMALSHFLVKHPDVMQVEKLSGRICRLPERITTIIYG